MIMNYVLRKLILGTACKIKNFIPKRYIHDQVQAKDNHEPKSSSSNLLKKVKNEGPIFIAAHVGSGLCRAAVVSRKGRILNHAVLPCKIYMNGIFREMSSENVWTTLVKCIKIITDSVEQGTVAGIAFTGIPALVCLDENGNPITASTSRDPNINIILHYDNRSTQEVEKIKKTFHTVLQYLGERVFPDFQDSKLMWLKNNLREDCWNKAAHFMDLTDFLTWKATGSFIRSSSSLVSESSYTIDINDKEGWNAQFFREINIPELIDDNFRKIGSEVQRPGVPLPNGLLDAQAKAMGLPSNLPVPTGMPDGFAGCLGLVGCNVQDVAEDVTNKLCIVFGTETASHFVQSRDPHFIKGVNGPFRDSVLPNMWLNHAGQTIANSVLDHVIDGHPATAEIKKQIGQRMHVHKYLNKILKIKAQKNKMKVTSFLTKYFHVLSDYQGNKSPIGDPWIRGMISGLSIEHGQESLALLYLATMQSLAYSTKHILSALSLNGHDIRCILIGSDLGRNSLFMQLHKDICQLPVVSPDEKNSKIIGTAILAGLASNTFRDFPHAIQEMCGNGHVLLPDKDEEIIKYHEKKYKVFMKMYDHQSEYRRIMSGEEDAKKMEARE